MLTNEQIAHVCHEANRAYSAAIGDPSPLPPWDSLATDYQASARQGVRVAKQGADSEAMHNSWMDERLAAGWRYGPTLDRDNKVHPNLVPYHALSDAQRRKDSLFMAVVQALTLKL